MSESSVIPPASSASSAASLSAAPILCRVCRKPVTPATGVAIGVLGKPLFYACKGRCADFVQESVQSTGRVVRLLMEAKQPKLTKQIKKSVKFLIDLIQDK